MQARTKIADDPLRQQGRAFARAKVTRHHWYVAGVIVGLAVLVCAALLFGRALLVAEPKPAKPPANVGRPAGYFLQRLPDGRNCRYVVFDNSVGEATKDKVGLCQEFMAPVLRNGQAPGPNADPQAPRFSWGDMQ